MYHPQMNVSRVLVDLLRKRCAASAFPRTKGPRAWSFHCSSNSSAWIDRRAKERVPSLRSFSSSKRPRASKHHSMELFGPKSRRRSGRPSSPALESHPTSSAQPSPATASKQATSHQATKRTPQLLQQWVRVLRPRRYRYTSSTSAGPIPSLVSYYGREHVMAAAWRLPLWLALACLASWDETAPFSLVAIRGPSMLPTMAADGSDLWLVLNRCGVHRWLGLPFRLRHGDLVGLAAPIGDTDTVGEDDATAALSCKRIVGLEGDSVRRYGAYVQLFVDQDPVHLGILWPEHVSAENRHGGIDPSCPWDGGAPLDSPAGSDPLRRLTVPSGHVWVEGDCPGLAVDSRQYGPVALDRIRGKVVARFWPLWRSHPSQENFRRRPHPVPLDEDSLRSHNVHRHRPIPDAQTPPT